MPRTTKHRTVADLLTAALLAEMKEEIHSMVLFGSVARGEETDDSDVDVLIITEAPFEVRQRIDEVSYEIDLEKDVFTQPVFFSTQSFEKEVGMRSYFSSDVIREGIVLYDDGTFERIHREATAALAGVPRG